MLVTSPRPAARLTARTLVRSLAGGLVAVLALAGCVAPKEQSTPGAQDGWSIEAFYAQGVVWEECGDAECATVRAPLDWDDPEEGGIDLALKRHRATGPADERIGSLLINPGGPGASGVEFLDYAVASTLSDRLLAAYDVVGFDPRGVGSSSAVECGDDAEVDEFFAEYRPIESQADLDAARAVVREFGETCAEDTGPLIGEIDTASAARDMDLIRALLGDEQLYYAGFSYGTLLGAVYADLFPDRVGRLLLDGALDPSNGSDEFVAGQAEGFEDALRSYVEYCLAGQGCPLTGDVEDGLDQVSALVDRIGERPLRAGDGRELNRRMAFYGLAAALYDDESWSYLTLALEEALTRDSGQTLYQLANLYLRRDADGTYTSNMMVAFNAINCLDYATVERGFDEFSAFADELEKVAPTFGTSFAEVTCESWPVEPVGERDTVDAPGAAPILVVGTTGDPATPYEWSVALAEQLESGTLLTWEGEGHTAYGRGDACVTETVDAYLVDGVVPEDGAVCGR
ncbi:alpha/beta hydrolase [Cellulomonas carbonis]|uniref:Transporter n=1 Tax=Cellulomonas carbonis T26 TaxID=947969 RepID=A0A0A0BRT3_9CELL|nr:alpha/beta hydrolase [Cellulomonas carbonis]KGM10357.1 transporter [Cellulomonas carbonis T26]GGC04479.1 alpha/beta hydrolase [Cellulomonas carbonis]